MEGVQCDVETRVIVFYGDERFLHFYFDPQLFTKLTREAFSQRFARFLFPAWKLPQPAVRIIGTSLGD